jgi:2-polyprenyl-3-methyl-5-hydroxy-6-metoxy-1,4-benzoquinol methylase
MTVNADYEHWSRVSREWIEWARAPDHDAFWAYRESLIAFVDRGQGEALDVGCGEGRVSRELKACGYRVTASDPVRELVNAAKEARSADDYAIASGTDLPFEDARFDLVMAYNVLMDVEDVSATLKRNQARPAARRNVGYLDRASVFRSRALRQYGGHFPLCHTKRLLWLEAL